LPAPGGYFSYSGRDSTVIATSLVDDLGLDFPMLTLSAADGTAEGTLYLGFTTHYRLAAPHVTYTGAGVAEKATWTPSGSVGNAGSVAITPDFGSYQPPFDLSYAGVIGFAHLDSLTLEAPDGEADFTLTAADGVGTLSGAVDGYYATHTATFTQVTNVNIYLGLDSGPVTFDSFAIGSVDVNGLRNLFISTGAGDDLLTLLPTLTSLITPVLGGQVSLDLGTGANVLEATADVGMSLQDGQLLYSGNDAAHTYAGYFTYPHGQIQTAHLTGGAGDNVFHVAWPYSATVDGLGGNDTFYLNGFTGAGTVNGGEGNDLFILQATSARTLDGAAAAVLVDGGAGQDTVFASGDVDYTLTDTALVRALPKTRGHAQESVANTFSSIEAATLNGGVSANLLNAAQFTGTATLIGDGGIDNLIASRGGGALYGYTTALEPAGDNTYTRDNYYLSDGTLDGVVDTIYATNRLGNLVSFRYYRGNTEAGVHFTMPDLANGREQLVTAKGAPDLRVALGFGRVNLLEGSQYADQLYGNKLANIISGLGGDDLLSGIGGDILAGGAGRDRFVGFTPYRYQDLTMSFAGAVVIPSLEPSALHAASLHVSAIQPALAAITRDEFTWLNPVATIVAAVAA
jgi:Ca2+-binding RTX toxin-like protein